MVSTGIMAELSPEEMEAYLQKEMKVAVTYVEVNGILIPCGTSSVGRPLHNMVPSKKRKRYILVGLEDEFPEDPFPGNVSQVKKVFDLVLSCGCQGLFHPHMLQEALEDARSFDKICGGTQYGVQKRPNVVKIDMVTGCTSLGAPVDSIDLPSGE